MHERCKSFIIYALIRTGQTVILPCVSVAAWVKVALQRSDLFLNPAPLFFHEFNIADTRFAS